MSEDYDMFPAKMGGLGSAITGEPGEEFIERFIGKIQTYELTKNRCRSLPDPIDEIKSVMRRLGLTNNDLKPYIGSSGNVSDVLMRRRPLSLRMIRNLHDFLGISAEILIQPYEHARR
jgi:HTH-type transcriptional regulator/antitoxin HigA